MYLILSSSQHLNVMIYHGNTIVLTYNTTWKNFKGDKISILISIINNIRESLYTIAIKGDWQNANNICKKNQRVDIWELPITNQKINTIVEMYE
jgi:hypothetical protein